MNGEAEGGVEAVPSPEDLKDEGVKEAEAEIDG
jgi:hypothetical protein